LIKSGAVLVTSASDVLEALPPAHLPWRGLREDDESAALAYFNVAAPRATLSPQDRTTVVEALGITPVSIDILVRRTGLDAAQIAVALLELDLAGRLEHHGQQNVSLRATVDIEI
jgi:DNA processing protein